MEKNVLKFDEELIKNYDDYSNKGYILEADVEYLKDLANLHSSFPFLSEVKKIKRCNKLVCNLFDKKRIILFT